MSILENELKRFDNMKEELQKKRKQIAEGGSNASRLKASLLVCLFLPFYAFSTHIPLVSLFMFLWLGCICGWGVSVVGVSLVGCICGWGVYVVSVPQ